ncbi:MULTISPECIES: MFS transporter [Frankia]|uniref:Integral membrane efflux protein n=1 Tax=Frankia alni (strain DSM 45986 / CECT 9034 / ACN14a) TaxID=326424 RepID=Q0RJ73_FRAAA|nr:MULTISPECIES: MFS transporter [Frankia]CAJ62439.1 Putative integral membrane efflux protein [Frankia alni ACN14a]
MDEPAVHPVRAASAKEAPAAGGGRSRELSAVLGVGGILTAISQVSIVPLLPDLPRLTGASASNVSWLLTVTLLVGAVVTPLFGRAGDIFGKRRMLLVALGMLTTGSVLCALTSNIWLLIPARGLQGACLAVVPLSISILRDELPPERVGSAVALMSATVGIGAALGVPFASLIIQFADWHVMFWVTGGLGLADLILAGLLVRESKVRAPARFDIPGAVGLALGLLCLLLALSKAADWGFTSPRFGGLILAAVVIFIGWARWQLRVADPLVDLRLARRPAVLAPNAAALLVGFSFYANSLSTAQLVQVPKETGYGLGLSVFASGLCLLPGGVAMFALSPVAARITASRGPRITLLLGTCALVFGYLLRMFTSENLPMIVVGAAVVAAGTALAYSAMPMLIMNAVPRTQTAAANGLNVLLRTVGQAMCSAAVAALLSHLTMTTSAGAVPSLGAFQTVFAMAGVVGALALAVGCLVPTRGRADVAAPGQPAGPSRTGDAARGGDVPLGEPVPAAATSVTTSR